MVRVAVLLVYFAANFLNVVGQVDTIPGWQAELDGYWNKINKEYKNPEESPLLAEDRVHFIALERFTPDPSYCVTARFKAKAGKVFQMRTSTERLPEYMSVGTLKFKLNGKKHKLTVYKSIALSKDPQYRNYLFVPFTDLTNGEETYGGGRYLDLQGPLGEKIVVDLNKAYNPYCAYGGKYSCPIPPEGNHLNTRVLAGVLKYEH